MVTTSCRLAKARHGYAGVRCAKARAGPAY